jgi:predicted Zn-dependent protease
LITPTLALLVGVGASSAQAEAGELEKLDGYAEGSRRGALVVDGQRVRLAPGGRFKGHGSAGDVREIPLGYEVKARGNRLPDGTLLAQEIEAKPNGDSLFESDLRAAFDEMESRYRRTGRMFEEQENGHVVVYGRLWEEGREVKRARSILASLVPSYLDPDDFRVYVVENPDWNAIAAPNGSFYVFSGLLENLDDDEVALVLGHELAHYTHEHSRKQFKKDFFIQLGVAGVVGAAEEIENKGQRVALQLAALLGANAWVNGYGRNQEDQADRVGMWYAYQAGYDVAKGPALWDRFAGQYGNGSRVLNFFFANHAASRDRAQKLRREIQRNYASATRRDDTGEDRDPTSRQKDR